MWEQTLDKETLMDTQVIHDLMRELSIFPGTMVDFNWGLGR